MRKLAEKTDYWLQCQRTDARKEPKIPEENKTTDTETMDAVQKRQIFNKQYDKR